MRMVGVNGPPTLGHDIDMRPTKLSAARTEA
jgi:hypothetical protein